MSKNKRSAFLNPCLDSSDDEETKVPKKKTRGSNRDAIKNPLSDSDDIISETSDNEDIISEDEKENASGDSVKAKGTSDDMDSGSGSEKEFQSPIKKSFKSKKQNSPLSNTNAKKNSKKKKETDTEEDLDSDDLSETDSFESISDDNISDSDFIPDSEDEKLVEKNNTINLSSDGGESPVKSKKKEATQTFDSNSDEFWKKVEELRNKGISFQQPGSKNKQGDLHRSKENIPSVTSTQSQKGTNYPKLAAFTQLCINFEHEKRCVKKCFLMEVEQKVSLSAIRDPSLISPDFVKACIRVVTCSMRMGDTRTAKKAITLTYRMGEVHGISALCQAMISGVKVHNQSMDKMERLEESAMDALRIKQFTKALELVDKALLHATSCVRLKMAKGDCLLYLGRYVEGAKVASDIMQIDQKHVGALFLRGFCLYHKNNIERAVTHFQQVVDLAKEHQRAKLLLNKAKVIKVKKDLAVKASNKSKLEEALKFYTEAIAIDSSNKAINASLLADRAEVFFRLKRFKESGIDCEKSLELDQSCMAALLMKAKCHMENKELEMAVRIFERMNNRDRLHQQTKKKAGDEALKANKLEDAYRLYSEAMEVDKQHARYRNLLREAKQQHHIATRVDLYAVLSLEKTVGESDIRKAYFKKSKEYHPDRHAGAGDDDKEEFSKKFKLAKEAYEVLSDIEKRKVYDIGGVKPPPGGWYRDVDKKILQSVYPRGGGRGRGGRGGMVRGGHTILLGGNVTVQAPIILGNIRPTMRGGNVNIVTRGNSATVRGGVVGGTRAQQPKGGRGGPAPAAKGSGRGAAKSTVNIKPPVLPSEKVKVTKTRSKKNVVFGD